MFPGSFYGPRYPAMGFGFLARRVLPAGVTNYTLSTSDWGYLLEFRATSNITVNLPDARACRNRWVKLILYPPGYATNLITFTTVAGQGIDGNSAGNSQLPNYSTYTLWSDGLNWRLMDTGMIHPIWMGVSSGNVFTFQKVTDATALGTAAQVFMGGVSIAKNTFIGQKINLASHAPGTPAAGDVYYDGTQGGHATNSAGHVVYPGGTFFAGTSAGSTTVPTGTDTDITPTGVLSRTIAANSAKVGSVYEIEGWWVDDSGADTKTIKLIYGATYDTGKAQPGAGAKGYFKIRMTVLSVGAAGTARVAYLVSGGNSFAEGLLNGTTITINTTASLQLGVGMNHAKGTDVIVTECDVVFRKVL